MPMRASCRPSLPSLPRRSASTQPRSPARSNLKCLSSDRATRRSSWPNWRGAVCSRPTDKRLRSRRVSACASRRSPRRAPRRRRRSSGQTRSYDHAVGAGIIAVGSRLDKNNYDEEMKLWARDPQKLLPKAVLLQANMAAVQAIGPLYLQQHLEQQQIDELTKAAVALKEGEVFDLTKVEYQLAEAKRKSARRRWMLGWRRRWLTSTPSSSRRLRPSAPALRATPKSTPRRSPSWWPTSRACWTR